MRYIDMQTWPRRDHYSRFITYDHPHFGMCANVDVTAFYPAIKKAGHSFTVSIVYLIARTANKVPEFRYRIRGEAVVEHEIVHPSFTILVDEEFFSFCTVRYSENFTDFALRAAAEIAHVKVHQSLYNDPNQDDLIYMSPIPWVSFTSFSHPMQLHPTDSVPRFAWGKIIMDGETLKMPLGVQGHHALMDGIHMGRYYAKIQDHLYQPELILGDQ